uniref:Protein EXECUTER 1, chloroplastic n=1 Tax=Chenopodium quinoa TaxID=63459 RepID=A0A803MCB2_CHEQI
MASPISPPTPFTSPAIFSDSNLNFHSCTTFSFNSPFLRKPNLIPSISISKPQNSSFCCCRSSSSDSPSPSPSPSSLLQQFLVAAAQAVEDFVNSRFSPKKDEVVVREKKSEEGGNLEVDVDGWDWERWSLHFKEVEEQERLINLLKSQLRHAIEKEDYEVAARLKVAIAAAGTKDAVGSVMCYLKNAIEEERYQDAVFVRDNAGAGLVGWWAGVSDDRNDPHGCIIRISAEHGRYVARSYSPRQLATSTAGAPLFEIYAVYLKREAVPETFPSVFPKSPAAPSRFQNILQDMIPGVRVKVLKVTAPGKVDRDLISKVVEQIIEEEDEDQDIEAELSSIDTEDTDDDIPGESDEEKDDGEADPTSSDLDKEEQSEIAVNVVVSGLVENLSGTTSSKDLVRVPAKLKSKGHKSFSFCIQDDKSQPESVTKGQTSSKRKANTKGRRSIDHVMSDLVNSISRGEKIPVKVLKDVGDLISLTLNQVQNRQPLSGSTTFNRIDLPSYPDPLNGLYIGSHGPYTSEVIQLKRKFGQWKEDGGSKGPSNLQFYEYVEAVKITGDPYVPAGQVAFRAKIGKSYQLPHKGIIPEEFGVVARYKGQGRLAEPGFRNPRWVDGELVILDGKYIKGGPVVGFVYWAPEYQFLVFFNRLRIEE